MNKALGPRVGVFHTAIRIEVLRLPIPMALVTGLAIFLTKDKRGLDTSNMDLLLLAKEAFFVWALVCCLIFLCLWILTKLLWKVTLFEGGVRGPNYRWGFRTLAWDEITSAKRIPLHFQSINPFHAVLEVHTSRGPEISMNEPLGGMQEFQEHVRRLAGDDHPLTRFLHERSEKGTPA